MTDHIKAALNRLNEYAAGNPSHDTDEIVKAARAELQQLEDYVEKLESDISGLEAAANSLYFDNLDLLNSASENI